MKPKKFMARLLFKIIKPYIKVISVKSPVHLAYHIKIYIFDLEVHRITIDKYEIRNCEVL